MAADGAAGGGRPVALEIRKVREQIAPFRSEGRGLVGAARMALMRGPAGRKQPLRTQEKAVREKMPVMDPEAVRHGSGGDTDDDRSAAKPSGNVLSRHSLKSQLRPAARDLTSERGFVPTRRADRTELAP